MGASPFGVTGVARPSLVRSTRGALRARSYSTWLRAQGIISVMARVEFTAHLQTLFPQLAQGPLSIDVANVRELLRSLDELAPGVAFYICDERGRLRRHVNIFVDGEMIIDRPNLSDRLEAASDVFIAQALSGG